MRTMDEAASTSDDLCSVHPDVAPGAEPWVDSSPGTAAAGAAAAAAVLLLLLLMLLVWRLCRLLIIEKGLENC